MTEQHSNAASAVLSQAVIDRILPANLSIAAIEQRYPARNLPAGAEVTRVAPSPTGFLHIGTMYVALISKRLAAQTGGVFCLRIEDTDRKREVAGARELIMSSLHAFGQDYDEGPTLDGEKGAYGPYTQSERQDIYEAYTRALLEKGLAYPCFMTPEEQEEMVAKQQAQKLRPGYYGEWAAWRTKSEADVVAALDAGKPFVIRFRSQGDISKKRVVRDVLRGQRELPENDNDIVIRKRDGLPTYHLAHVVDDHLMGTTTVIRADEWLPSCTLHVQLCEALGFEPFTYGHIAPIQKMDGSSRRKLSKRHDPEANVEFYLSSGYPVEAVIDYLLNQANAAFEEWRRAHPTTPNTEYVFDVTKLPKNAGALLNLVKLDDFSKDTLGHLTPEELYEVVQTWSTAYDAELAAAIAKDVDYTTRVFAIERENAKRKDIAKLADIRDTYGFFFDDLFGHLTDERLDETDIIKIAPEDRAAIAEGFLATYNSADTQDEWFAKVKALGEHLGYTANMKEYRKDPSQFRGSVADVAMVLRVALTGRNRSPNLYEVLHVMGEERMRTRIQRLRTS